MFIHVCDVLLTVNICSNCYQVNEDSLYVFNEDSAAAATTDDRAMDRPVKTLPHHHALHDPLSDAERTAAIAATVAASIAAGKGKKTKPEDTDTHTKVRSAETSAPAK